MRAILGQCATASGLHGVGKLQQLLRKVIDGIGLILKRAICRKGICAVKEWPIERAGDGEHAGEANRAEAFDPVSVLQDLGFTTVSSIGPSSAPIVRALA